MEPVTLISSAIALVTPYLIKSGEKLAEKAGEGVWNFLKKPFTRSEQEELFIESPTSEQLATIESRLLDRIKDNPSYIEELNEMVTKAETSLNQQNINNQGTVEKQVNIQTNTGDINL